MTVHNYITPEGEVRWVKDMPKEPIITDYAMEDQHLVRYDYLAALSKAKEESVPWGDTAFIKSELLRKENTSEFMRSGPVPDTFYSFEFNGEVKVLPKNHHGYLSCCNKTTVKCYCGQSVAHLIPSVTEQKETQKPTVVETEIDELWRKHRKMNWEHEYAENGVINKDDLIAILNTISKNNE